MAAIDANGITIEYDVRGEGEPLLLVMGLSGQLIDWPDEFVDLLVAAGFQVIRFDNRDAGLSTEFDWTPPSRRALGRRAPRPPPAEGRLSHRRHGSRCGGAVAWARHRTRARRRCLDGRDDRPDDRDRTPGLREEPHVDHVEHRQQPARPAEARGCSSSCRGSRHTDHRDRRGVVAERVSPGRRAGGR